MLVKHIARPWSPPRILAVVGIALAIAGSARAQTPAVTDDDWRQGTTLAGLVGAASPFVGVDPAIGLSVGWEITPRFGVEGRGTWFPASAGVDAFAAAVGARVAIQPARPVVPFVSAGVGLFRATLDVPAGTTVPGFYERRLEGTALATRTFDDFMVTLGGGVELFVSRHIAVRPEVAVLLVTTRSDTLAVPQYGVQLAYHFESHPITPARLRR